MKDFGVPVIFDATHSVQKPSTESGKSGGDPEFIETLSKCAASSLVDGFFLRFTTILQRLFQMGLMRLNLINSKLW